MFYGNILNESSKNELPKGTLSGDLKNCVVDDTKSIFNDELKKVIEKIWSSKVKKAVFDMIHSLYDEWYYKDDDTYSMTEDQVKKLAIDLLDSVFISKRKDTIVINYWINNNHNHKDADKFFNNHSMSTGVDLDSDYNIKEFDKPSL